MRTAAILALFVVALPAFADGWLEREAQRVEIVRDDWGIAHVRGKTDADAVFGMAYAQAEDDLNRVETNYLTALGMAALADGEKAVWQDLRQKLFLDPAMLKVDYAKSPTWLKALMNAWADGLNWYLASHPDVKPKVIAHYEPWMALAFSEGSIGGDIEDVDLDQLRAFYGKEKMGAAPTHADGQPGGSNGIAIAPSRSADGHALLLINPHVRFFFRSELQMTSDQGLDAYGAVTWGQFFIYQGFNRHIGWMHTSTGVDNIDEFAETIVEKNGKHFYRYGSALRPMGVKTVTVPYRTANGTAQRTFTTYYTSHGPVVREANGKWISIALMNRPVEALEQSFLRTKATDYASYMKVAALQANSSNNTVFADDKGEIAFLVPQFVPRRDNRFDYTKPVDGSDPATDWHGLTPLADLPQVVNPPNGWLFNTNDWPWSAAGPYSPKASDYPKYLDTFGENPRGLHATMLLTPERKFTLQSLEALAFDSYLPAFATLIPTLVKAYDGAPDGDPLKAKLKDQIALLRSWDFRWSDHSLATTLSVLWGDALWDKVIAAAKAAGSSPYDAMANTPPAEKLATLADVSDRLSKDFGNWRVPWGAFNRYQRLDDSIAPHFSDDAPSIPIPFTYSRWGSLASSSARRYPGTKRYYGSAGNSFVAVVEFGPKVKALAISTGGESGDPKSPHFSDQALRYARGQLRPVYFTPEDLQGHVERAYHPGAR